MDAHRVLAAEGDDEIFYCFKHRWSWAGGNEGGSGGNKGGKAKEGLKEDTQAGAGVKTSLASLNFFGRKERLSPPMTLGSWKLPPHLF
jgi:hypothetical protein